MGDMGIRVRKAQVTEIRLLLKDMPWIGSVGEFVDHAVADKIMQARAANRKAPP